MKQELKYILFSTIFAIVWFVVIMPMLLASGIEGSSAYFQFIIFNVGIFIFLQLFLKAATLSTWSSIKVSIGLVLLFMALDIFAPPFSVSTTGQLLGATGDNSLILAKSGSDYILGYFATNSLGLSGIMVYIFTYILAPFVMLFAAAKLIPNFVRSI